MGQCSIALLFVLLIVPYVRLDNTTWRDEGRDTTLLVTVLGDGEQSLVQELLLRCVSLWMLPSKLRDNTPFTIDVRYSESVAHAPSVHKKLLGRQHIRGVLTGVTRL